MSPCCSGSRKARCPTRGRATSWGSWHPICRRSTLPCATCPAMPAARCWRRLGEAAPDGATIGWVITPTLPARMIDRGDPSLGQRIQLIGAGRAGAGRLRLPVGDPANSIQDIIRRASDDADAVPLGTPPAGSPPHLAALRLQVLAQTQLNIVTFPSSAAARQAVLARQRLGCRAGAVGGDRRHPRRRSDRDRHRGAAAVRPAARHPRSG